MALGLACTVAALVVSNPVPGDQLYVEAPPLAESVAEPPLQIAAGLAVTLTVGGKSPSARLCSPPAAIATTFVRPEGILVWP